MGSSKSTYMTSKRASTLRTSAGVVVNHQQPFQTMQNSRMIRPNIVENPLEEPIYHTLGKKEENKHRASSISDRIVPRSITILNFFFFQMITMKLCILMLISK